MKTKYKFGTAILIALALGSAIGYTIASNGNTFIISQGVYPHAVSYTIWKESSVYYAKNEHGNIDYSGTNASNVIQSCIYALQSNINGWRGGVIYFLSGEYILTTQIIIPRPNIHLIGESYRAVEIIPNFAGDIIKIYSAKELPEETYTHGVKIKNLLFYDKYDYNGTAIYFNIKNNPIIWYWEISDIFVYGMDAIRTDSGVTMGTTDNLLQHGVIRNVIIEEAKTYGIYLEATIDTFIDNIFITWGTAISGTYGIWINVTGASGIEITNARIFRAGTGIAIVSTIHITLTNIISDLCKDYAFKLHDIQNAIMTTIYGHSASGTGLAFTGTTSNTKLNGGYFASCNIGIDDTTTNKTQYFTNVEVINSVSKDWDIQSDDRVRQCNILFQNFGNATITSSTSVIVTHGLYDIPISIIVTMGSSGAGDYYVDTVTSTQFTIHVTNSGTYTVFWFAEYG